MVSIDELMAFTKNRGFVYQSSEIYDGVAGIYDFGPLGVLLKRNIEEAWWKKIVNENTNVVGLDSAIVLDPKVWDASGHTKNFSDPITFSKKTGKRYRVDHLLESIDIEANEKMSLTELQKLFSDNKDKIKIDGVNPKDFSEPTFFNLLATTNLGYTTNDNTSYLRGETCQGIYINYKNVMNSMNFKIPFGIAQIGKAFRNEISARQFLFRLREFSQLEFQYFCHPSNAKKLYLKYKLKSFNFIESLGIDKKRLRFVEHEKLAFYAKSAVDIEYKFPFGWGELQGIHNRGDHDLKSHQECSKKKLDYFDEQTKEKYIPYIIETSMSIERLFLVLLFDNYITEKLEDGSSRVVLKLQNKLAPYKIAVLPLFKKQAFQKKAMQVYYLFNKTTSVFYDETQSIGRRYRRQDEIGTPYCITIDHESLEDDTVTIRNRDTMKQEKIDINDLSNYFKDKLN